MMHPCIVQIRDANGEVLERSVRLARKFVTEIDRIKNGIDIYFEDVREARKFISTLKRLSRFDVKFSTKFAGLRRGRVRVLFVYCLRFKG